MHALTCYVYYTFTHAQAFIAAWNKACSLRNAVFLVPDGFRYLVRAVNFQGPCMRHLVIQVNG